MGGAYSGGDEKAICVQVFKKFAMKIALFHYDARIVITLSIKYDDYRRPRRDAPSADQ
jgi:hypothetical protein